MQAFKFLYGFELVKIRFKKRRYFLQLKTHPQAKYWIPKLQLWDCVPMETAAKMQITQMIKTNVALPLSFPQSKHTSSQNWKLGPPKGHEFPREVKLSLHQLDVFEIRSSSSHFLLLRAAFKGKVRVCVATARKKNPQLSTSGRWKKSHREAFPSSAAGAKPPRGP